MERGFLEGEGEKGEEGEGRVEEEGGGGDGVMECWEERRGHGLLANIQTSFLFVRLF